MADRAAIGFDIVAAPQHQRDGSRQGGVGGKQTVGLGRTIAQGELGGHTEGVEGVDVATRGQDLRATDQIAAGDGGDEAGGQGAQDAGDFGILLQLRVDAGALGCIHRRQQVQVIGTGGGAHRPAQHMQAIGDQGGFGFQQFQPQRGGGMARHIDHGGLFGDQCFQLGALGGGGCQAAPAGE